MSTIKAYLRLIPRGFKNLPQILNAVTNQAKIELGTISKEDFEVIVGRRMICRTCPFFSTNVANNNNQYTINGKTYTYEIERGDEFCIHCGCPYKTRTAGLTSNCGLEVYNAENEEGHKEKLKWEAVK